jgi:rhodanese-related sulfurtransferase
MTTFGIHKPFRTLLRVVLGVGAVIVVGYFLVMRGGDVTGAEARRLVEAGARLVDVRTPEEFAAGHIPGAVNIPVGELDRRMGELEPKNGAVVVYCRSGNRSGRATRVLESAGYARVHDLGAMSRW